MIKNSEIGQLAANTIRFLAADGVEKAKSGHPGMPMGMADCAFVLWSKFLKFNPQDPQWLGRDRFVLSAGHGSMLLYSLLYLAGYDVTLDDLKNFRQWNSRTPGHPEYGCLPGVEMTTGPLGQGFSAGVGMAIAAKMTAARLDQGFSLFDNQHIFGIVSDGDLMEGVASEAASLAGHLKLGNIVYLYDDNKISIEGSTTLAFSEDVATRFKAYGWQIIRADGHNHQAIADAIQEGIDEKQKPTLVIARTHIAFGAPNKQDTAGSHGAPLGEDELKAAKEKLGWPVDKSFYVPDEVLQFFKNRIATLQREYDKWMADFKVWQSRYPDLAQQLDRQWVEQQIDRLEEDLLNNIANAPAATRKLSGNVIQKIAEYLPGFCGGSADLAPSTNTIMKAYGSIQTGQFDGRNLHFGVREHAMGAILNGMALYGGIIPFGATFLQFADYMRPAIRLAAMMKIQVIYVFTHDSIFVGEDGPTHQPIEHLAALRTVPNLTVIRPADAYETALAWTTALRNHSGPTALILTRQNVSPVAHTGMGLKQGAYIISDSAGGQIPELIIIASGSELSLAVIAGEELIREGHSVRIVSAPSLDLFKQQPATYRETVICPDSAKVVVIEAASLTGWGDVVRNPLLKIGIERFGESAPYQILAEKFGFTKDQVLAKVRAWLAQ
jgi:transketolase